MRLPSAFLVTLATCTAFGQTYTISTFAGGGLPNNVLGTSASLNPQSVAVDNAGNVFIADVNAVLRLDAATGLLTVVAGNGVAGYGGDNGAATWAELNTAAPPGAIGTIVAVDDLGDLYIADCNNYRIRKVSNGVITTVVGTGVSGFSGDNGPAVNAQLSFPAGVGVDAAGNLYIADGNRIRKVSNGVITTVAGNGTPGFSGDGSLAASAQLNNPLAIAVDSTGNLYIADYGNNRIRKVSNGGITTVAGGGSNPIGTTGPATSAQLYSPQGVALDSAGNLYIAQAGRYVAETAVVDRVVNGVLTPVAGGPTVCLGYGPPIPCYIGDNPDLGGPSLSPTSIALDSAGNLFIADPGLSYSSPGFVFKVLIVTMAGIYPVAGGGRPLLGDNGPATSAQLQGPQAVARDSAGDLYIAETYNYLIRKVSNGVVTTVAGNGTSGFSGDNGPALSAQLYSPNAIAADPAGNLYIADSLVNRIRKVSNGVITTVAGNGTAGYSGDDGPATSAELNDPGGVAADSAGNLYIADTLNNLIRKVANGVITTVAGGGSGGDNGPAIGAELYRPQALAVDPAGNLYIVEFGGTRIRKVSNGVITTVAGNGTSGYSGDQGPATSAQIAAPQGIAADAAGNLYIADTGNECIRKVSNGIITTVAGNGTIGFSGDNGPATGAQLNLPSGVALDDIGNVYIADFSNNRIRVLTPGTAPVINQNGVVPIYSSVPVVQSGSWVSIYGSNLASGDFIWNNDFPTSLGGVSVTIDNKPAWLWTVSPTQINLQVPDDPTTGPVSVVLTTPSGTATSSVTLAPYGPSFSLLGDGKHAAGEIATPNGTGAYGGGTYDLDGPSGAFSYNTRPVKPGEILVLYGVGFGPTTPFVPAGQIFFGSAPANSPVAITIGGVAANVVYAGITEAGTFQFNVVVPDAPVGDQPLLAIVNGIQTPPGPVVTVQ